MVTFAHFADGYHSKQTRSFLARSLRGAFVAGAASLVCTGMVLLGPIALVGAGNEAQATKNLQEDIDLLLGIWRAGNDSSDLEATRAPARLGAWRDAAKKGSALGQFLLGRALQRGLGVSKDEKAGIDFYRKAAEQGCVYASTRIGLCYLKGVGVEKDDRLAFINLRKAALQGDFDAQFCLGVLFITGTGVEVDSVSALDWWRKSVDQGSTRPMCTWALLFAGPRRFARYEGRD